MGRTKEFQPEEAVARALDLFWAQGYDGTSLGDLTDHLGVNRQSLYDTFGGKEQLYLAAMDFYKDQIQALVVRPLRESPSGMRGIEQVFETVVKMATTPGRGSCFMANTAIEFGTGESPLLDRVAEHMQSTEAAFVIAVRTGRERGEITSPEKDRALARYLLAHVHGLGILARAGTKRSALNDVVRVTLSVLRK